MSYILSRYFQTNNRKKENPHDGAAGFRESKHRPADPSSKSLQRRHTTGSLYSYPTGTLEKGRSRIKDLLERFKQQKAGYDGVAHRSRTLYLPESVPYRLDSGTCLQCGHETPHEELLDQSRIDGYVVGICNDCYPEFLRSLEDTNETQDLEPTVEPERIDWDERPVFGIAPETIREARRGTPREITRQCEVCREPRIGSEFRPATFNCQHDIHYCVGCLGDWISSKIESRELDGIQCPSTECRSKLDAGEVQAVTDRETFERYTYLSTTTALSSVAAFRWCLGRGCKSGQIHETGTDGYIFRCHACGFKVCVIHNVKWHEGETCKEYDYRTKPELKGEEESASQQTITSTTKPCPRWSCGAPIEKNEGCDHMKCRKCGYEFCWLCLAGYTGIRSRGNSAHNVGCTYYTSQ